MNAGSAKTICKQERATIQRVKIRRITHNYNDPFLKRKQLQINIEAERRLRLLSKAWGCSQSAVVERLLLETDKKYGDVKCSDQGS